jgi:PhnB protein
MPESTTTLIPHLSCRNAADAAEFYQRAFGAEPLGILKMPDGRVMHGALSIRGATFFLVDEFPEHGGQSPQGLGGSPVTLHLQVPDCDAVFERAVEAGCTVVMPLDEMFWGDRYGMLKDPFGHKWSVATTVRQVSPEELQQAMASFSGGEE